MIKLDNTTHTAVLRLFKAVLVPNDALIIHDSLNQNVMNQTDLKANSKTNPQSDKSTKARLEKNLAKTMAYGYMFDATLDDAYITDDLITLVNTTIGMSAEQANQSFHKSWQTICESSHEQLAIQQMTHYMTTYGFERLGIYDAESVFIPNEILDIPMLDSEKLKNGLTLQVIQALTLETLLEKVLTMASGIALAKQTLADLMIIIRFLFSENQTVSMHLNEFIEKVTNRELHALLCDEFDLVPNEPVAFLRHVVMTVTGESLLIKNQKLIKAIKDCSDKKTIKKMDKLLLKAPDNLASIFLRYKPLFLALKSISNNKTLFNRLRKQAKTQHQPLPTDYLNSITHAIKMNTLNITELEKRLGSASIYRKIRLANALLYRMSVATADTKHKPNTWNKNQPLNNSIVYRVRNGRGWATEFTWQMQHYDATEQAYNAVVASIANDLRDTVAGKTFYMPEKVNYTLPATEKQFTGGFPTGSWVAVPDDLIVGIHWHNAKLTDDTASTYDIQKGQQGREYRVDLDLSLMTMGGTKVGWNASHYSQNQDLVFSGDMTDAPNPKGATELFYVQKGITESQALMVNYFNYSVEHAVPCKLIVAHEKVVKGKVFKQNYMVDPNNILMQTEFHVSERQNMLGLINHVHGENRIYFANMNIGTSIASYGNEHTKHAQQYLLNTSENVLMLRDVLQLAGANVVTSMPQPMQAKAQNDAIVNKATTNAIANEQNNDKSDGLLVTLINKLVDSLVPENKPMVEAEKQVAKPKNLEPIIDLSPAKVNKATFIDLLNVA